MMAPAGVAHHGMLQHAPMPMQPQHPHQHQLAPQPHHPHLAQQQQQQQQQHQQQQLQQHAANVHSMTMAPGAHHHGGAPVPMAQPHHLPPHQAHQQHQQAAAAAAAQQAQNNAIEAAKRRSRKPTDKTMPDGVEDVVVGDGVQRYRDLRDFERRLDATMTRKRLDIVDSVQRNGPKRYKTLRIWVSNTVENQLWQTDSAGVNVDSFDFSTNAEASYRVKIEGRLLDDDDDDDEGAEGADETKTDESKAAKEAGNEADGGDAMETDDAASVKAKPPRYRFTQFFRAMSAEYVVKKSRAAAQNGANDAEPRPVEWKRPEQRPPNAPGQPNLPPAPVPEFDELTFKRPGDDNVNIVINLFRYEEPERFALDEVLSDIVDMQEATRAEAVMGLFEYIRLQNLQEDEEKRNFRCDDLLRRLVNNDIGYVPMLHEYVNAHIRPLPPIQLPYTIRVDEAFHRNNPQPTIYDVRVTVDDPLRAQLRPFVQNPQYIGLLRDVGVLDEQLAVLVQAISMSKSKHEFLSGLARDPARFVRQWLSSQKRDLDMIMGESVRGGAGSDLAGEAWRRGGKGSVWASQNARESVNLHLAKQPLIPRTA
ncbi:uncharacterized protein SPSK_08882 [Sporothrix schenckii 1099-18]|uniref:DM2 domain-containing protein n=1 Tax=Sporothrix schenckii 1099-18 TaxID=1397361 RepID=A0A0F2M6W0_SPOSC|nr:uncharacterized protein SPSK_08882 [Sporothrix schenckii 1099-18]KJR85433.1 hypothetical protein SPSK_08882 [Sporothrix schenckii 1099-18]